jgi:hypothetical protein
VHPSLFILVLWAVLFHRYASIAVLGHRLSRHELRALAPQKNEQKQYDSYLALIHVHITAGVHAQYMHF